MQGADRLSKRVAQVIHSFGRTSDMSSTGRIALFVCALLISRGSAPGQRNLDVADLRAAAESGNPAAKNRYAEALFDLEQFADSLRWFELAADAGITNAQWRLGHMYSRGKSAPGQQSVPARPADAFRWLLHASLQGHKHAQLEVGRMYQEGLGTERNNDEALMWFCIAAEHGLVHARTFRDRLMLVMSNGRVQEAKQRALSFRPAARDVRTVFWDGIKLKGIAGPASRRLALVNEQTLAQGEQAGVKTAARTVRLRCVEISDSSAIVELVDFKEIRRLPVNQ